MRSKRFKVGDILTHPSNSNLIWVYLGKNKWVDFNDPLYVISFKASDWNGWNLAIDLMCKIQFEKDLKEFFK